MLHQNVAKTENNKYQDIDEDFPLGTQEDQDDAHELKEDGRHAKLEKDHKQELMQVQKKPSMQKSEEEYEDDFHDDDDDFKYEEESSAKKSQKVPVSVEQAKTPEVPTPKKENQKPPSGKASTSNDDFKDYGDYDDEDEEEQEDVAPKPKVTFPFQAAAPADPLS